MWNKENILYIFLNASFVMCPTSFDIKMIYHFVEGNKDGKRFEALEFLQPFSPQPNVYKIIKGYNQS